MNDPLAAIASIGRVSAVPTILRVINEATGLRLSLVAHVTDSEWTCCAVSDRMAFGLEVGGKLEVATTLCSEVRSARTPITISHASQDPVYSAHHTPKLYKFESYIAVPIFLRNGDYFGNVCALDANPIDIDAKTLAMFQLYAELIGLQLDAEAKQEATTRALLDERETAELREQFIAVLGHDLRTPLNAIALGAELLEARHRTEDASTLRRIKGSTARISKLVDDVLDFARGRLGSGIGASLLPIHDIEAVFRQVIDELQAAHPSRRIDVEFTGNAPLLGDRTRLAQLLQNLLGNALTHSPPDAKVSVSVARDGDRLRLEIANGGPPLSPELVAKMFAPFQRGTDKREGLGLGLYIASEIVRSHGGTIAVTSSSDATRITCHLPLAA